VDAYVGDGVEPNLDSGLDGGEFGELEAVEEILFNIANTGFDTALLIAASDIAGCDGEAVMAGKIEVTRIEDRCDAGQPLQDADLRLSTMTFAGTPPNARNACS